MVKDYEAKTEKEAIEMAANDLGLERDQFDVEILETQKSSLFKKGFVKIRVHTLENNTVEEEKETFSSSSVVANPLTNSRKSSSNL